CLGAARIVIGDKRLAIVDAHRQIKDGVVGKRIAAFGGPLALIDVIACMSRRSLAGDETQEKAAAFLDSFAQDFLPVLPDLDLLFIQPDQASGVLELLNDVTGDLVVWRGVADEDAAAGSVFFTMGFVHKVRVADWCGMFLAPAIEKFFDELSRVNGEDVYPVGETTEIG